MRRDKENLKRKMKIKNFEIERNDISKKIRIVCFIHVVIRNRVVGNFMGLLKELRIFLELIYQENKLN